MSSFEIKGGCHLKGEIIPQGAKNEALQILCAVLLTPEEITIHNIPDILDVNKLIELLSGMGVKVKKTGAGSYSFKADAVNLDFLETEEFRNQAASLRGSVMILGPLLARFRKGSIPRPGGDKIGRRRLDTHFIGLQKLGAAFDFDSSRHFTRVTAEKLTGTYMLLDEASVTGTANLVMAASMASKSVMPQILTLTIHDLL